MKLKKKRESGTSSSFMDTVGILVLQAMLQLYIDL